MAILRRRNWPHRCKTFGMVWALCSGKIPGESSVEISQGIVEFQWKRSSFAAICSQGANGARLSCYEAISIHRSDQSWPLLLISGNEFFKDSPDLSSTGTDVISLFYEIYYTFASLLVTNYFKLFYLPSRNSVFGIYYYRRILRLFFSCKINWKRVYRNW